MNLLRMIFQLFILLLDVLKVIFSVNDMRWLEKEHKIRNLAARYRDIWNANSGYAL